VIVVSLKLFSKLNASEFSSSKVFREKCFKFCSILFSRAGIQGEENIHKYFCISDKQLRKLVGGYQLNKVKSQLEKGGVIEIDHHYSTGHFSKRYRLSKKWFDGSLKVVDLRVSISNQNELPTSKNEDVWHLSERIELTQWLLEHFKQLRFSPELNPVLDENACLDFPNLELLETWGWSVQSIHETSNICHAKNLCLLNVYKISQFSSYPQSSNIQLIHSKRVGRLFSPLTSLKREARNYLRNSDGDKLCEIDCNACHAFLLLKLYDSSNLERCDLVAAEKQRYFTMWGRSKRTGIQDFYAHLIELCNGEFERKSIKAAFLADFLNVRSSRGLGKEIERVFMNYFPILLGLIKKIKSKRYFPSTDPYWILAGSKKPTYSGQLAVLLMRLESQVFIDEACGLIKKKAPNTKVWTIHDSLVVEQKNASFVKDVLHDSFMNVVGYEPLLVEKELCN
jgi:hypothetical protein